MRTTTAIAHTKQLESQLGRRLLFAAVALSIWLFCAFASTTLLAQDGVNQGPDAADAPFVDNQFDQTDQEADRQTGEFNAQDLVDRLQIPIQEVEILNQRIQPFAGRSIERFGEQELYHPRSQITPGSPNGSGGGVGGGGGNFRGGGNQNASAAALSFQVARQSIRTHVIPSFRVPVQSDAQVVSTRFQNRIARLPATRSIGGINVRMDGRTAVLSGSVGTQAESRRVERMARLEPGVYRIQNQIQVVGQ